MPDIKKTTRAGAPLESTVQDQIRLALGREPDLVLWRLSNGARQTPDGKVVQMGIAGAPDLVGILKIDGRGSWFALEVKAPGKLPRHTAEILEARGSALSKADRHELAQLQWARLARSFGAFVAFVDSVDSARDALRRARRGELS